MNRNQGTELLYYEGGCTLKGASMGFIMAAVHGAHAATYHDDGQRQLLKESIRPCYHRHTTTTTTTILAMGGLTRGVS